MMNYKVIEDINTDRLVLRKFTFDDAQMLFENYGCDEDNTKYMLWKNYKSVDDAKKSIEYYINCYEENSTFRQYAIELKSTKELIGQISFDLSKRHHFAEIAYVLGKKYQRQGYMKETIDALVDYLFNEIGCNRISAEVMIDNEASINLLKKCGFIVEGIERKKYITKQNEVTDVVLLSIIKE